MTAIQDQPDEIDDSPELDASFFANAKPALDDPDLARVLARHSLDYRNALQDILAAHEAGAPVDDLILRAKALLAAE